MSAAIGPIAEIFETEIAVVGGARLARQIGKKMTPDFERAIDAWRHRQHRCVKEPRRNSFVAANNLAPQLAMRAAPQRRVQEMRSRRQDEGFLVIIEKHPWTVGSKAREAEATEGSGVGEMMKFARILRE
ncbi:hypothetical protein [Methylovirgula sp. HY1]|uniref:hypothetical protein n=1 Tax=Methylovirgula sp. HY1 TaxID=2822761 RepID=UPI001C5A7CD3|nr:hypothetical protein [Methylovirgula sp. HY1]